METRISNFFCFAAVSHHTALWGVSPAELMWRCTLRPRLDLLRPESERKLVKWLTARDHDSLSPSRQFRVNDTVYARNYGIGVGVRKGSASLRDGNVYTEIVRQPRNCVNQHVNACVANNWRDVLRLVLRTTGLQSMLLTVEPESAGANQPMLRPLGLNQKQTLLMRRNRLLRITQATQHQCLRVTLGNNSGQLQQFKGCQELGDHWTGMKDSHYKFVFLYHC